MRTELFYNPLLLMDRLGQWSVEKQRLRKLRGTPAASLQKDHVDSLELIELAAAAGAKVFYDIGANVGLWTLLCRALVPDSTIVAFEPMNEHIAKFRENTRTLSGVRLFSIALGSREETRPFFPASFSDASSFLPLTDTGKSTWHIDNARAVEMKLVTLDEMMAAEGLPPPDLVKLDVQGFELEVLRGADTALSQARWVLSEVSFKTFYDGQVLFSELVAHLASRGYEVTAFGSSMRTGVCLDQVDVLFARRCVA